MAGIDDTILQAWVIYDLGEGIQTLAPYELQVVMTDEFGVVTTIDKTVESDYIEVEHIKSDAEYKICLKNAPADTTLNIINYDPSAMKGQS